MIAACSTASWSSRITKRVTVARPAIMYLGQGGLRDDERSVFLRRSFENNVAHRRYPVLNDFAFAVILLTIPVMVLISHYCSGCQSRSLTTASVPPIRATNGTLILSYATVASTPNAAIPRNSPPNPESTEGMGIEGVLNGVKGCSPESGIMVFDQKTDPGKGAPFRCYHSSTPTASTSPSTTTVWWPTPGCCCRQPSPAPGSG